ARVEDIRRLQTIDVRGVQLRLSDIQPLPIDIRRELEMGIRANRGREDYRTAASHADVRVVDALPVRTVQRHGGQNPRRVGLQVKLGKPVLRRESSAHSVLFGGMKSDPPARSEFRLEVKPQRTTPPSRFFSRTDKRSDVGSKTLLRIDVSAE